MEKKGTVTYLLVTGITEDVRAGDVRNFFKKFGKVGTVELMTSVNVTPRRSVPRFAHVSMGSKQVAEQFIEKTNGQMLLGGTLTVSKLPEEGPMSRKGVEAQMRVNMKVGDLLVPPDSTANFDEGSGSGLIKNGVEGDLKGNGGFGSSEGENRKSRREDRRRRSRERGRKRSRGRSSSCGGDDGGRRQRKILEGRERDRDTGRKKSRCGDRKERFVEEEVKTGRRREISLELRGEQRRSRHGTPTRKVKSLEEIKAAKSEQEKGKRRREGSRDKYEKREEEKFKGWKRRDKDVWKEKGDKPKSLKKQESVPDLEQLAREKERLRQEWKIVEREKQQLAAMEMENQRLERQRLEMEKEEIRKAKEKMEKIRARQLDSIFGGKTLAEQWIESERKSRKLSSISSSRSLTPSSLSRTSYSPAGTRRRSSEHRSPDHRNTKGYQKRSQHSPSMSPVKGQIRIVPKSPPPATPKTQFQPSPPVVAKKEDSEERIKQIKTLWHNLRASRQNGDPWTITGSLYGTKQKVVILPPVPQTQMASVLSSYPGWQPGHHHHLPQQQRLPMATNGNIKLGNPFHSVGDHTTSSDSTSTSANSSGFSHPFNLARRF